MYPGHHAQTSPDKAAAISARTGEVLTYAELDARSNRLAQLLWAEGLRPRRPHRGVPREPPPLLRGRLGRVPLRALPHHGQPLPDRAGGQLHRGRLRRAGAGVLARVARGGGGDPRARAGLPALPGGRRPARRRLGALRELRGGRRRARRRSPSRKSRSASSCSTARGPPGGPRGSCDPCRGGRYRAA